MSNPGSGLLAFHALRFPRARVVLAVQTRFYFLGWLRSPAFWAFGFWLLYQGAGALFQWHGMGAVSFLAHVGGAAVGLTAWTRWRDA